MDSLFGLIVFLVLLAVGYFVGRRREKAHYDSIKEREHEFRDMILLHEKVPPPGTQVPYVLVTGSVVVSVDYFKSFLAGLRNFVGGRISAYESLLDRARREAILRMKEEARALRCNAVTNVRVVTTALSQGAPSQLGTVEVLAYGTALVFKPQPTPAGRKAGARLSATPTSPATPPSPAADMLPNDPFE